MLNILVSFNTFGYTGSLFLINYCNSKYKTLVNINTQNSINTQNTQNKLTNKRELDYNTIIKIFDIEPYFLKKQLKKYSNLSVPFNRNIKYIYGLPHYYIEYENYDFNKLSDFFLNIHIFIN